MNTADLCDQLGDVAQVLELPLFDYGGQRAFSGRIATVVAPEDNTEVRAMLEQAGDGRVLVVDGKGSRRCALVGDRLAALAHENGWAGIVVFGCVRDVDALAGVAIGIKAIGSCPRRSVKGGAGAREVPVTFGGVTFTPGGQVTADRDGVVVSA